MKILIMDKKSPLTQNEIQIYKFIAIRMKPGEYYIFKDAFEQSKILITEDELHRKIKRYLYEEDSEQKEKHKSCPNCNQR